MQAYGRAFPSGTCLRETPTPKHLRVVRMFISSWGFAYLAYPRFKWKYLLSNYRLFKDACSWSVIGSDRSSCLSEKVPFGIISRVFRIGLDSFPNPISHTNSIDHTKNRVTMTRPAKSISLVRPNHQKFKTSTVYRMRTRFPNDGWVKTVLAKALPTSKENHPLSRTPGKTLGQY